MASIVNALSAQREAIRDAAVMGYMAIATKKQLVDRSTRLGLLFENTQTC